MNHYHRSLISHCSLQVQSICVAVLGFVLSPASAAQEGPCGMDVTYYVPSAPLIQSSATDMTAADQVTIRCDYKAVSGRVEWQSCDSEAQIAMQILQVAMESGSRYSGLLTIDGQNVGVTTSPAEGGDFSSEQIWSYGDAGNHEVICQIDNGLKYAAKDGADYLRQAVVHEVAAAIGIDGTLPLNLDALKQVAVQKIQEQIAPLPENAKALLRVVAATSLDPNDELASLAMDAIGAQPGDGSTPSDTGLVILPASVEPYCYEGYVQLYVFGTMQNAGATTFPPPGSEPVVRAALELDSVVHTGLQAVPVIPPGESQDFAIEIVLDRMMTGEELSGWGYRGEFGVYFQRTDDEAPQNNDDYRVFDGKLPSMTCP